MKFNRAKTSYLRQKLTKLSQVNKIFLQQQKLV